MRTDGQTHRTMQDYIDEAGGIAGLVYSGDPLLARLWRHDDAERMVFECACGRMVDTAVMLDLTPPHVHASHHLTAEHRQAIGTHHRFRCDGCWTHWVRVGLLCKHALRKATGQPPLRSDKCW